MNDPTTRAVGYNRAVRDEVERDGMGEAVWHQAADLRAWAENDGMSRTAPCNLSENAGTVQSPQFLEDYEGRAGDGYRVTRIYRADTGELIRIRTRYDAYQQQSHALAEVMTPGRAWTLLLEDPADRWHGEVCAVRNRSAVLVGIAGALAVRANTLLCFVPPTAKGQR